MPINELEQHPCLNYPKNPSIDYKGIVIGTFPVYGSTDTLDQNLEVCNERCNLKEVNMKFFYGSKESQFWDLIASAFDVHNPIVENEPKISKENAIRFLEDKELLISDVLWRTNRGSNKIKNDYNSEDKYLMITDGVEERVVRNRSLNYDLRSVLDQNKSLAFIYFTATGILGKSPFGWFKKIFGKELREMNSSDKAGNRIWAKKLKIYGREYTAFFLPTPKERGVHLGDKKKLLSFINYLQVNDIDFYNRIKDIPKAKRTSKQKECLTKYRRKFLIESYRQAFVEQNVNYDGSNPVEKLKIS